jgi:hypothetical protein
VITVLNVVLLARDRVILRYSATLRSMATTVISFDDDEKCVMFLLFSGFLFFGLVFFVFFSFVIVTVCTVQYVLYVQYGTRNC